jgi:hypothetical protein
MVGKFVVYCYKFCIGWYVKTYYLFLIHKIDIYTNFILRFCEYSGNAGKYVAGVNTVVLLNFQILYF